MTKKDIFSQIHLLEKEIAMERDDEIYIMTTAKNGLKVSIPLSKLEDFKRSQENPDKEKIKKAEEESMKLFLEKRAKLQEQSKNKKK